MKNYMLRYTHVYEDVVCEVSFIAENDEQALVLKARFEADGHAQDVELFDSDQMVM